MALKLDRYKALISGTEPTILESIVRELLIHYYFHLSNKMIVQVRTVAQGARNVGNIQTPTLFKGLGCIRITSSTQFGWPASPGSYSCSYVDARTLNALIEIGENTIINNGTTLIAEGAGISIGDRCLIGSEVVIMDTNFHEMEVGRRHMADSNTRQVVIGNDVFIGSRVTLMKGSNIGDGCIISNGAVVMGLNVAPMSIIAGNPARIVGRVPVISETAPNT
jgi:maltose O-acetyltransferase